MKTRTDLEQQFREECTVINMDAEYPGNPSPAKWVIITGYTREELVSKYSEVLATYTPYEIANSSVKKAIDDFNRNEDKYKKRQLRGISIFTLDEDVDAWCPSVPSFVEEKERMESEEMIENFRKNTVQKALDKLTDTERKRLLKSVIEGKTVRKIAEEENCSFRAVAYSISEAKNKLRKNIEFAFTKRPPLSKYSEGTAQVSGARGSSTSND